MLSLILDTNVVISGLIGKSSPYKILELILTKKVILFISDDIFEEYVAVINRDKFSHFTDFISKASIVLNRIDEIAVKYNPNEKVDVLTDKDDNIFLELALCSNANYLVTGNIKDFKIPVFNKTNIVTPSGFLEKFRTYKNIK
jgi:putative PIN family toxin of toxin-antitoxin system